MARFQLSCKTQRESGSFLVFVSQENFQKRVKSIGGNKRDSICFIFMNARIPDMIKLETTTGDHTINFLSNKAIA